jgi:hypothetical protein
MHDLRGFLDWDMDQTMKPIADIIHRFLSAQRSSKWLKRTSGPQEWFAAFHAITGISGFVIYHMHGLAMLPSDIYGPDVMRSGADWWSISLMMAGAVWFFGIQLNGHAPRWSSSLRLASNLILATVFFVFVSGALPYSGANYFVICCAAMGLFMAVFSALNLLDLIGAVRLIRVRRRA